MPPESSAPDPKFAIGHVLFIDIVGYSKLLINEQSELIRQLNGIVSASEQFRLAEAEGKLIRLPTGDGMALMFRDNPEAPVQCALEITRALRINPQLHVRMGIHSGPVNEVNDLNNQANLTGAGINLAQRVMDCGDAGHILLSRHVAEDLEHYARWRPYLHDLGECEVKHGVRVSVVNFHSEEIGNPELPQKFERAKQEKVAAVQARRRHALIAAASLLLAILGGGFFVYQHRTAQKLANDFAAIPLKSIAVLPFENLSANPENAFFADGVQDEILTDLARIADLKVISRTSVMQYKSGATRNARAIARALGVAHLLEGSVQRADGKVRINAQLIDARSDTHLWAQSYDRDLADLFAIQSEIAKAIADQLRAKLSPNEKAEIDRRPTTDVIAFDLYSRAKTLLINILSKESCTKAVELLQQAIVRDPSFFLAYCDLAYAHTQLYFLNYDHTLERCALADSAAQTAARLRPEAGETHLARAQYFYSCHLDYDRARAELAIASQSLPNNSNVVELIGYIDRRQGRWSDSARNLEKALQLDPRNFGILVQISASYGFLRRYAEDAAMFDRALELAPDDVVTRLGRAQVELVWRANLRPYHDGIRAFIAENPKAVADVAAEWFGVARYARDASEATQALAAISPDGDLSSGIFFPHAWYEGLAALLRNDTTTARDAFSRARREVEFTLQKQPDYGPAFSVLGLIDALLGRKEEAIREGRRAVELLPIEKDSILGSPLMTYLAKIYTWTGEKDLAVEELETIFRQPGDLSYGDLKLDPSWDALRGDARFEKLVSSLAPKE